MDIKFTVKEIYINQPFNKTFQSKTEDPFRYSLKQLITIWRL